eukprot:11292442-Ditylum_brightwellii.AAC.1
MESKINDLLPGQRVCADHYHCAEPRGLYTSRGATGKTIMYTGGCIFVDNASVLVHIEHQVTLSGVEMVRSKLRLDRLAAEFGVKVHSFHTNNGVLTSTNFMDSLLYSDQSIRFSGAGAAYQNGIAEREIKIICDTVQSIMIHTAMHSEEGHSGQW